MKKGKKIKRREWRGQMTEKKERKNKEVREEV